MVSFLICFNCPWPLTYHCHSSNTYKTSHNLIMDNWIWSHNRCPAFIYGLSNTSREKYNYVLLIFASLSVHLRVCTKNFHKTSALWLWTCVPKALIMHQTLCLMSSRVDGVPDDLLKIDIRFVELIHSVYNGSDIKLSILHSKMCHICFTYFKHYDTYVTSRTFNVI